MSSIKSLLPPKLSVAEVTGGSKRFASLGEFYSKLPKGPLVEGTRPGFWGRYYSKYIRTSSPMPILHVILGVGLIGYTINYQNHLTSQKQKASLI
ncbi:1706_t:CDS:2 [Acaulospora morrowiae]|uniref:1706_t:CDS:1 n=1 Tax=Acaulospora morrowiae TaxID=94023 RepID=A0A9N8Z8B6_9GLOM|nr:1706_t:CDS:2 [Acaulospora morrowiae]